MPRQTETRKKWFVFMDGEDDEETISGHSSYKDAVFEAQSRGCTESRPKRLHAGFYTLTGCSGNQYQIATPQAMEQQGYEDLLKIGELHT